MYDDSEVIFHLYLEGAAEDMTTNTLTKLGAPDDVQQLFLQKENGKLVFKPEHVGALYGWIKDQHANKIALKSDYQNYLKFLPNTPLNLYKSYVDWTEQVHAKRDEATYHSRHKHLKDIELEGEDKPNVLADDADVMILKGDDEHRCVRYGRGYSFCISRPGGGNMYGSYRTQKASTFYFVFFKNVSKSDPRHIMVLDRAMDGWEWTFANNHTKPVQGGWDEIVQTFPVLQKYEHLLINKPMTPEEESLNKRTSSFAHNPTKDQFDEFNYAEQAHVLKLGTKLPIAVFDDLDKYLRNEWLSVGPVMSEEIYAKLTPSEISRFVTVRKQQISQNGIRDEFDEKIFYRDAEFRQEMQELALEQVNEVITKARRQAAESTDKIVLGLTGEWDDEAGAELVEYKLAKLLLTLPDMSDLTNRVSKLILCGSQITSLKGLPQGLEEVVLDDNTKLINLEGLPQSVKSVYCRQGNLTTLEGLPQGVESVICGGNQLTTLKGLPQSISRIVCNNNQLTTLEGLPRRVKIVDTSYNRIQTLRGLPQGVVDIRCDNNQLTSLKGLPQGVEDVCCNGNQLTTLEGLPQGVKGVSCHSNQLITLEGLPQGVEYVRCDNNQLTSLEGLPQGVENVFCSGNQLTTLEGLPQGVAIVDCSNNKLTSLEGLPQSVKQVFCHSNQITTLKRLPQRVERLYCSRNQLTTLDGVPSGIKDLNCDYNPGNFTKEDIENAKRGIFSKSVRENTQLFDMLKRYLLLS